MATAKLKNVRNYRNAAKQWHPDHISKDEMMKRLNFARDVLSDPRDFARWKAGLLRYNFDFLS